MPLDPLGSLSDPTCHDCTVPGQACAKLTFSVPAGRTDAEGGTGPDKLTGGPCGTVTIPIFWKDPR